MTRITLSLLVALALTVPSSAHAAKPLTLGTLPKWPADVLVVMGVPSLDALASGLDEIALSLGEEPMAGSLRPAVLAALDIVDIDPNSIDGARPINVALLDPKKHPLPLVAVLPLKDGTTRFINGPPGTEPTPAVKKLHQALAAWKPTGAHVTFEAALAAASDSYAAEVATMRSLLHGLLVTELSKPDERADAQQAVDAVGSLIETFAGTERFTLALELAGGGVRLAMGMAPRKGTSLEKTAKDMAKRKVGNAGFVPDNALFVTGWNVPAETFGQDVDKVVSEMVTKFDDGMGVHVWTPEETTQLRTSMKRLQSAQSSPSVMWLRPADTGALLIEAVTDLKDGRAFLGELVALGDLIYENMFEAIRQKLQQQGQDPNTFPKMAFPEFVQFASGMMGSSMGMSMRVEQSKTAAGNDVLGMGLDIAWDKVPGVDPGVRPHLQRLVGKSIALSMSGESRWFAVAFGEGASAATQGLLARAPAAAKQKSSDPVLEQLSTSCIYMMLRPNAMLAAVLGHPPANDPTPVTLRSVSNGKRITTELEIPVSTFTLLKSLP